MNNACERLAISITMPPGLSELPSLFAAAMGAVEGVESPGPPRAECVAEGAPESHGAACERLSEQVMSVGAAIAASFTPAAMAAAESFLAAHMRAESLRLQCRALGLTDEQASRCVAAGIAPDAIRGAMGPTIWDAVRMARRLSRLPLGARAAARRERKKKARRTGGR